VRIRLLFFDDDGREWLVQDGNVHHGEFQLLPLGTPLADFRVFDLTIPRERRIYSFNRDQHHAIDEALLERQFVEAKLVTTSRQTAREAEGDAR
jgi:hypothetical protein